MVVGRHTSVSPSAEWDWEPRTWGGCVSGLSILQASPTIPLKSSSLKQHWCSDFFFFPARIRRSLGEFMDTAKTACLYFLFNHRRLPYVQEILKSMYVPICCLSSITSPPIPLLPFSSSSSAASSGLFLLMMNFQNSWYYMLKIPMKIRYRKVPGSVISLVLSNVLITEAFSYLFTIIFTYLIVYAFVFLFVCFVFT